MSVLSSAEAQQRKQAATARSVRRLPRPATAAQYAILLLLLILAFFLVVLMIDLSLRPTVLIYADFWGLPWPPIFSNYSKALLDLLPSMWRTLWISAVSIAGVLTFGSLFAYAVARMQFPGRGLFFALMLLLLMIPGPILLTPQFILADNLGLRESLWGLCLFYIAGGLPFAIFLITTFFRSQPVEIFEAARIDGASEVQALLRVALPLAMPILVTVAIFNFIGIYGDYIWPTLMLSEDKQTLLMALTGYANSNQFTSQPDIGVQTAGYAFATVPQLIIFILGMKYFIQGVTSGAVKA